MRISDWSSDVCSSDLDFLPRRGLDDQAAQCRREREAEEIARGRAGEYAEACCAAGEDRDTRRADRDVEQDGQEAADGAEGGASQEYGEGLQRDRDRAGDVARGQDCRDRDQRSEPRDQGAVGGGGGGDRERTRLNYSH